VNLKDQTLDRLTEDLSPLGFSEVQARRLFAHVLAHGRSSLDDVRDVPRRLIDRVRAAAGPHGAVPDLAIDRRHVSLIDGFTKYLFRAPDGGQFESVRIPLPKVGGPTTHRAGPAQKREIGHYTLCISSQIGCALACVFCATGRMGAGRNLATWEIVDQVLKVRAEADHPVRGVVFMGQGEPFLNYDNVIAAARILSNPAGLGISARAITISTAGVVPAIRRFTREGWKFRLAVSLTAATSAKRRALMPIEKKYNIEALMDAVREYAATTTQRMMIEYVAIGGVNCGDDDAALLGQLLRGLRVRFNIIEVNDASGAYVPPGPRELDRFRTRLSQELGQPIVRRYSGGQDVRAGCGMLAAYGL
jgi:23S rRNA (adenine2503-C2)-methyltransferase